MAFLSRSALLILVFSVLTTILAVAAVNAKDDVFTLGEIEVKDRSEVSKNVTIEKIYEEDMRDFNRNNVAQAVNLLPGVTLTKNSRNEQMVYVRGFDMRRVPIFLDGIPIYVPYDGYPDLGRFTTFDMSQITLSKGFTSVLYGPNTEGGAINMISKRPENAFEGNISTGYATGDTFTSYINLGTNQKKWYLQGGGSYVSSDYFRLSDNFRETATENGGNRENSYYRDRKFNFKVGLTPAEGHEYAVSYINQHGVKGNPPYAGMDTTVPVRYWQWPYWDKESVYFTSKTPIGQDSYFKVRLFYDQYQNSLYSYDNDTYSTMKKNSSWQSDFKDSTNGGSIEAGTTLIPRNNIKAAFHYKEDYHKEHNQPNPYQNFKDEIMSVGLEDTLQIVDRFYTIFGASYDTLRTVKAEDYNTTTKKFSDFETDNTSSFNPQIGFFYDLTGTARLHASVAKKTRLPTMKDKYSYKQGTALPNPGLKPEESINYELGYQDTYFKKIALKTAVFYSDISDMVLQVKVPNPSKPATTLNQNQNIGDVRRYGVELDVSASIITDLDGGFNYTYIYSDNRTDGTRITDIPKHKFAAYAKYTPLSGLNLIADIEYNSQRYSSTDGVEVARAFAVTNFKAAYQFLKGLTIEGGVSNIFDRDYALAEGYPEAGRSFYSNLVYKF
ncbi:MAG: TonB-dependent receptor [Syntrophorhabdaceae bacterium]|nr:TonB-dependent receptor [Syntrophorhabdaceae bacterium]